MFQSYSDNNRNIVSVTTLRLLQPAAVPQDAPDPQAAPGAQAAPVGAGNDFWPVDAVHAFDPNRFPLVRAFDAAHYPGACIERYRVAVDENPAAASRYPLLGPRQAPTVLLSDREDENDDLTDLCWYTRRTSDGVWVLENEPIISSTTDDTDDNDILPFERIGRRVSIDSTTPSDE